MGRRRAGAPLRRVIGLLTQPLPQHLTTVRTSIRASLLLAAAAIVLATVWLPQPVEPVRAPLLLLAASASAAAAFGVATRRRARLERYGGLFVLAHGAAVVWLSGGAASIYAPLFGMFALYASLYYDTLRLVVTVAVILLVLALAQLWWQAPATTLVALFVHLAAWGCAVVVVHRLVTRTRRTAQTDALTRLWNHGAFWALLRQEHERVRRGGAQYTLILADIDRFKTVNDERGHLAGDEVLRRVAEVLSRRCRASDTLARYGGEEFALLLPATTVEDGVRLADDLRVRVEAVLRTIGVTLSAGVASSTGGHDTAEAVLAAADRALYRAKQSGRNRVLAEVDQPAPAERLGDTTASS